MNQKDYLMALYDALEGLPAQVRADTLSEYRSYFKAEAEKGRSEADIAASLGDPAELAAVIKNRNGFYPEPPSRPRPNRSSAPRFVLWTITAVMAAFVFFGISAAANIFKGGWDNMLFGFGTKYDVNELKEVDLGTARKIEIRTTSTNTSLITSSSDKVKASLIGRVITTEPHAVPTLEVTQSGDVITIVEKRQTTLIMGSYSSNLKLDITIPEGFKGDITYKGTSGNFTASSLTLKSLTAELSSGNVKLGGLSLEGDLYVSSTSGNMAIDGLNATNAVFRASSGDKEISDLALSGNMEATSSSGTERLENITCNELRAECTSGDITASRIKVDSSFVTSSSGNIRLDELDGKARIKATSGNIEVEASTPRGEYELSASSGNINLHLPSATGFSLNARATSGNISCDFKLNNEDKGRNTLKGAFGSGEISVSAETTSGNIHIIKR